ncbi:hypothetical protein SNE40_012821 [Patella caerulea]|uniref:Transferrin-like domain-containing protein n=1 Tax=Patella caerulea TaxID=87958 RepID=A0AAN8JI52_PATCE
MNIVAVFCVLGVLSTSINYVQSDRATRWCTVNQMEEEKCLKFKEILAEVKADISIDVDDKKDIPDMFECVRGVDVFACMEMIEQDLADLMTLDAGQGYFGGRYHNMMPIVAENYNSDVVEVPKYYSVAVFKKTRPVSISTLRNRKICFPGIGTSAGWLYPISILLDENIIPVTECNAVVKSVTSFFGQLCLPGALSSFYNPFGNNPTSVCHLCNGVGEERCSTSDPTGGYDGAFRCVAEGRGDLTFLRHDTVAQMTATGVANSPDDYGLLCPNGQTKAIDDYATCNWGKISSHVVMTSAIRTGPVVQGYKDFILKAAEWYGPNGIYNDKFKLFSSDSIRRNLMFSDSTMSLQDVGEKNYYDWVGANFTNILSNLNRCPLAMARWCVISLPEKEKCESMMMAFKAKDLRPELDCLLGGNTTNCMDMIQKGDADLMNLDAGDIYLAGRKYDLVPIAAEDYGDMSKSFKVVAVARKTDSYLTLFNMKGKRACHTGIGRGDGWVIPLNIYIETEQFLPTDCSIFENLGQLFVRSCIPGALDKEYNPNQMPINLCEGCGAQGYSKCMRNSVEQYYGASGAFRCLVERGGDVAFVRHLTIRDNTDGRNHAQWSRNRRSDDYELMCKDGRRISIDRYKECHLGSVPANAIVTASHKSDQQREIYWNLINFGQQFFSSDIDGDFHLFDSGMAYTDLLFTDAAVRFMKIYPDQQNYKGWLGPDFVAQIENLQKYTCVSADSPRIKTSFVVTILTISLFKIFV